MFAEILIIVSFFLGEKHYFTKVFKKFRVKSVKILEEIWHKITKTARNKILFCLKTIAITAGTKIYQYNKVCWNICYFFRIYCDIICLLAELVDCCKIVDFPKIIIDKKSWKFLVLLNFSFFFLILQNFRLSKRGRAYGKF